MDYSIEEISPVERKVQIKVAPQEVDAALASSIALHRQSAKLDGFRKGKAPAELIEKRFHDSIYKEALDDLITVHINDILKELEVQPVSKLLVEGTSKPLERGKEYEYTLSFDVFPQFELPPYDGLNVEEEKTIIKDEDLQAAYDRIVNARSKWVPVDGDAPAKDGQMANIDFQAFKDGKLVEGLNVSSFDLEIGAKQALQDFEDLVKGLPVGHTGEKVIHFPDDFLVKEIAGQDLNMKVTVNAVKEKVVPELTEEFAKNLGYEDLETLKESVAKSYEKMVRDLHKGAAETELLEGMLKQTDFMLPKSLVDMEINVILNDLNSRLERKSMSLESTGKTPKELRETARPEAERIARSQILLMAIAKKENLEIDEKELAAKIFGIALQTGANYKDVIEDVKRSGAIFQIRDKMLADKAMELVYSRANVTMVDPRPKDAQKEEIVQEIADDVTDA